MSEGEEVYMLVAVTKQAGVNYLWTSMIFASRPAAEAAASALEGRRLAGDPAISKEIVVFDVRAVVLL